MQKPVVIVGGGLAGLTCARRLFNAGVPFLVFESTDRTGGRLKTDFVEGFTLDHGFQVLFTEYPGAQKELDFEALDLKAFSKGALVFDGRKLNTVDKAQPIKMLRERFLRPMDLLKLKNWTVEIKRMSTLELSGYKDENAAKHLKHHGLSDDILDKFIRPFLGGIFLDRSLDFSSRQMAFIWKMIADGQTTIPSGGMETIPLQLSQDIPKYLFRMNSRVRQVNVSGGRATGVTLDTGEVFEASAVIVATEADVASDIADVTTVQGHISSTCLYFETPKSPSGTTLTLNGTSSGLVNHVAPLSAVAPSYAPSGKHLVSATILGNPDAPDDEVAEAAKSQLAEWFPEGGVAMWRFLRAYRVRYAQMPQPGGIFSRLPQNQTGVEGLLLAGEMTTNASIDGAIRSGATAANLVIRDRELVHA
jgi:phytoene dehydrogenase-like protein